MPYWLPRPHLPAPTNLSPRPRANFPQDEAEQEALIREFEAISASSRRMWQLVWGLVALSGAAFYAWSAWQQHVEPWGVVGGVWWVGGWLRDMVDVAACRSCCWGVCARIPGPQ